jgi:gliding motility-associated-like protein
LSNPNVANPIFRGNNTTADSVELRYVVTVSDSLAPPGSRGCVNRDTTTIVLYRLVTANAGPDRALCSNDTARLGQAPVTNVTYAWTALGNSPLAALSATNLANPVFRLRNTTNAAVVASYVLTARNALGCLARDTVQVRVVAGELPTGGRRTVRLCAGEERAIGQAANPLFRYRWAPATGLSSDTLASPTVRAASPTADSVTTRYVLTISNGPCLVRDTTDVVVYRPPAANAGPDRTVCSGETVALGTNPTPGLTYQWLALAGASLTDLSAVNVANPQFSLANLTGADARRGYVVRVRNPAGCVSQDTVLLTITARVETSGLAIQGPASVCAQAPASYTLNRTSGNRYQWEVRGGQLASGQGTASVRVNWGGDSPGQLTVTETTTNGCTGTPVSLAVTINPLPRPRLLRADSVVCRNDLRGKIYQVGGLAGSRFGWSVAGGRIVATTPDSAQVTIDWDTVAFPKQLSVTERSAAGCVAAAPLRVRVELDGTAISLRAVGTQLADERNVEVRFRIANAPALAQTFTVERRPTGQGNFQAAGTVQATDTLFTDRGLDTDANSFEYRIRRTQQTGACPTVEPAPHASVRLQATALPGNGVALNWSAYQGWPRLARYEIWRRADGGSNVLLGQVNANVLTNNVLDSRAGFTQCFRVRAIEAGTGRESWSNEVCLGFEFPLVVPNVITPNGDGRNDRFVVPNLELYQQPTLQVFNRYGQLIYDTQAYRNDWDGGGFPTGTYFYVLRAARPGQTAQLEYKGWVQVLR